MVDLSGFENGTFPAGTTKKSHQILLFFFIIHSFIHLYNSSAIELHKLMTDFFIFVGSAVEWLKHRAYDQHGLSSKPTCAILLCSGKRHFTAHSPAWWSWHKQF